MIGNVSENVDALREKIAAAEAEAEAARAALKAAEEEAARKDAKTEAPEKVEEPEKVEAESASDEAETPQPPAEDASPVELSDFATEINEAYSFDSPAVTIGALIDEGVRTPSVHARMPLSMFNRHMLVAGATGSGKTRTLQLLTEGLSAAGTPVLLCDVKGDLTGMAEPGPSSEKLLERTRSNGQEWAGDSFPLELLSLAGVDSQFPGATVRTRISDFGPILLARALDLNTTQEQSLNLIFSWADKQGLELIDLADLRSVITFLTSDDGKEELESIGGLSKSTAGVILRALTTLESQGGDAFFGEPAFDTAELLRSKDGRGVVSLLGVGDISGHPAIVSALIMWLLADLFSGLPEVGDVERPKLVFFFDEAHLLFADATKEFLRQVIQTVRLIRSKGVGIVFVTQTPKDIPSDVLAQLGSRIQHVLRAVTPADQKKLKQTVETFPTTELVLDEVLTNLGTGEAVVTVLDPDGRPTPVAPVAIWAPASVMGAAEDATVASLNAASPLVERYATSVNPVSAEEKLLTRAEEAEAAEKQAEEAEAARQAAEKEAKEREKELEREIRAEQKSRTRTTTRRTNSFEKAFGSMLRAAGTQIGREITRTIFGTRRR